MAWAASSGSSSFESPALNRAGERSANLNLGLIRSMFHQPFGTFQGTIRDSLDTKIKVDNLFGVTEHHISWW